jgi:hypothetical protein
MKLLLLSLLLHCHLLELGRIIMRRGAREREREKETGEGGMLEK